MQPEVPKVEIAAARFYTRLWQAVVRVEQFLVKPPKTVHEARQKWMTGALVSWNVTVAMAFIGWVIKQ